MTYKNIGEIIYCGIVFDEQSQEKLRKIVEGLLPEKIPGIIPSNVMSCHHVTLAFGDNVKPEHIKLIGSPVTALHPSRILLDDLGSGIFFELKEFESRDIPWIGSTDGAMPHCTLYHRIGVPPVVIGTMPTRNHSVLIADPTYSLDGKIGAFIDGKWYF